MAFVVNQEWYLDDDYSDETIEFLKKPEEELNEFDKARRRIFLNYIVERTKPTIFEEMRKPENQGKIPQYITFKRYGDKDKETK